MFEEVEMKGGGWGGGDGWGRRSSKGLAEVESVWRLRSYEKDPRRYERGWKSC